MIIELKKYKSSLPTLSTQVCVVVGLSLTLGVLLARESLPYIYHPDEPVLLKQPFKRLIQYRAGDFSSPFSLYDFLLVIWLGATFLFGYLIEAFPNLVYFQEEIILESPSIILAARLLSVVLVSLGNFLFFSLVEKWTQNRNIALLFALLFVFNPFLLSSAFKVKFEALVYLSTIFLFSILLQYLYSHNPSYRYKAYFWAIFSLSVRIELVMFLILLIGLDLKYWGPSPLKTHFLSPKLLRTVGFALLGFSLFTLLPLSLFYTLIPLKPKLDLVSSNTFFGNIILGFYLNVKNGILLNRIYENWNYYIKFIGVIFSIPLITYLLSIRRKEVFWLLHPIGIFAFLLINILSFPRYFLPVSTGLLVLLFINYMRNHTKRKLILSGVVLTLISFVLFGIQFLLLNFGHRDPRTLAKEFIEEYTDSVDLIAMETISGAGFHPPILECKEQMLAKIQLSQRYSPYASSKYQIQIKRNLTQPCRKILDICEVNYLEPGSLNSNAFLNTKDISHFQGLDPKYFISVYPLAYLESLYPDHKGFYQALQNDFFLVKSFSKHIEYFDPRVKLLNTRKSVYVYKKT